jgi:hypothetical protein
MTSLAPNPLFVSLITTATTLPIFLFALPSGILSDIFISRVHIYIYNIYSARKPHPYWSDYPNNTIDTFSLGVGTTVIRTPIIPTLSVLVPRIELPAALTLSALASCSCC